MSANMMPGAKWKILKKEAQNYFLLPKNSHLGAKYLTALASRRQDDSMTKRGKLRSLLRKTGIGFALSL
jgi:hypothetical protein